MLKLTNEIIEAAIGGFEAQKQRVDAQIAELRAMLTGNLAAPAAVPAGNKPKRKISAAGRRRMKEAQQRRWANLRGESAPSTATLTRKAVRNVAKPKRKLSAAGRANIIAALKKRHAAKKAPAV